MTLAGQEPGSESPRRWPCSFTETAGDRISLDILQRHCCAGWRGQAMAFGMGDTEEIFKRWELGKERTTITTLHTETNQIFTALAPRWIPTCWSRAWLATSWRDLYGSSDGLALPRQVHDSFWSHSLSQVQRQLSKTLWMQTVSGYDTRMGWVRFPPRGGTWNPQKWSKRQDASWVANRVMEFKTHNWFVCFLFELLEYMETNCS